MRGDRRPPAAGRGLATRDGEPAAAVRRAQVSLVGLFVFAAVVIAFMGRHISLIGDQWAWIFPAIDPHFGDLFHDYNGHLIATTYALYDALTRISLEQLWIYRVVALGLHLLVACLMYCVARRRLGSWLAFAPTAVVLFLGTGADAYLSGLNYNELAAVAACLAALLTLDRRSHESDVATSGLLLLGLLSFSNAIAFAGGVTVELLFRRDRRLYRLWIPLIPLAMYGAWRLHWGSSSDVSAGGPLDTVKQAYRAATGAFAGVAGVQLENFTLKAHFPWLSAVAQIVFALLIVAACSFVATHRGCITARLANLVTTGVILWVLIGIGRGGSQEVYASRYVYQGAIVALLIMVELARLKGVPSRAARRVLAIAVIFSVALNIGWMAVWARHLRQVSEITRAQLGALEIARDQVRPSFKPDSSFPLAHVTARDYFAAVRAFDGSPAYSAAQLRRASEEGREAADRVLIRAFSLGVTGGGGTVMTPPPARVEQLIAGRLTRRGSCMTVSPRGSTKAVIEIAVRSSSGITLEHAQHDQTQIDIRRYAERFQPLSIKSDYSRSALLRTPLGRSSDPWHVRLTVATPIEICS